MAAAEPQDPYLVLGVARTATDAEIRAAYRALGAKYHPDRHQGNPLEELASAKMSEINRAYEILSDPARRRAFDGGRGASQATHAAGVPDFVAAGRTRGRGLKLLALLSLFPFVLRFGGLVVRGLVALFRELVEGLTLLRGTPFVAGGVLLTVVVLVVALLRRRRAKSRRSPT
ncbi:MAG TPA: J domain-containing protein [Polyangia bacterium]|jgi:hypothetical protein